MNDSEVSSLKEQDSGIYWEGPDPPDYEKLQSCLMERFIGTVPVNKGFWELQRSGLGGIRNRFLAADFTEEKEKLILSGFPEIKTPLQLLSISYYFQGIQPAKNNRGPVPPTQFFVKDDIVAELSPESNGGNLLQFDKKTFFSVKIGDRIRYLAAREGYLLLDESSGVYLADPVIIEQDRIKAWFVFLPVRTDRDRIFSSYYSRIKYYRRIYSDSLITEDSNENLFRLSIPDNIRVPVLLCEGIPPIQGKDASLIIKTIRDDSQEEKDSIDYKEFLKYSVVEKGSVIAEKIKVVRGEDGIDIEGKRIPAGEGKDITVTVNNKVLTEELIDKIIYRSLCNGFLKLDKPGSLIVEEIFKVNGDVNYQTGNIYYNQDVYIIGDVKAGFTVSGKDIIIEGTVEDKANIAASGNLKVKKGIIGEQTQIRTDGSLKTGFIQDASVYAAGDILVDRSVTRGTLFSGGSISVKGKGIKSGNNSAVMGSKIYAMDKLLLHSAGSLYSETTLSAGYNPIAERRIRIAQESLKIINRDLGIRFNNIPAYLLTPEGWKRINLLTEEKKSEIKEKMEEIKKLYRAKESLEKNINELQATVFAEAPEKCRVSIKRNQIGRIHLRIGEFQAFLNRDKERISYKIEDRIIKEERTAF